MYKYSLLNFFVCNLWFFLTFVLMNYFLIFFLASFVQISTQFLAFNPLTKDDRIVYKFHIAVPMKCIIFPLSIMTQLLNLGNSITIFFIIIILTIVGKSIRIYFLSIAFSFVIFNLPPMDISIFLNKFCNSITLSIVIFS